MDIEEKWNKAVNETQIIRSRLLDLSASGPTQISYISLGESLINIGDTVVRKGQITVNKPMILLPKNLPQFLGFEFEEELGVNEDAVRSFLLVRGISFPSLKYSNESSTINVFEGRLDEAISFYGNQLERKEDIETGLLTGPTDSWQFSLLIYVSILIHRSAPKDLGNIFDEFRRRWKLD